MIPRALMVADDPNVLRLLCRVLAGSCELSLAGDCREALARIESQPFDVVLASLRGRRSLDVLRAAKARSPDIEVIVFTDGETPDTAAAYALGAYECLAPFDPEDVARAVARALERSALRAEVARLRSDLDRGADPHA